MAVFYVCSCPDSAFNRTTARRAFRLPAHVEHPPARIRPIVYLGNVWNDAAKTCLPRYPAAMSTMNSSLPETLKDFVDKAGLRSRTWQQQ
jgi:hypothetical protein